MASARASSDSAAATSGGDALTSQSRQLNAETSQPTAARRINRAVRSRPVDSAWVDSTLASLEHLVMAGDEANLAERVVELIASPGGDAAAVGPGK